MVDWKKAKSKVVRQVIEDLTRRQQKELDDVLVKEFERELLSPGSYDPAELAKYGTATKMASSAMVPSSMFSSAVAISTMGGFGFPIYADPQLKPDQWFMMPRFPKIQPEQYYAPPSEKPPPPEPKKKEKKLDLRPDGRPKRKIDMED